MLSPYAELHCLTNFSFLHGASQPHELVERAQELGYKALAITDECSLAGVVRAYLQARASKFPILIGAQFSLRDLWPPTVPAPWVAGARLVLLAQSREGYGNLSELITRARMREPKGSYKLLREDLVQGVPECVALFVPDRLAPFDVTLEQAAFIAQCFAPQCSANSSDASRPSDRSAVGTAGSATALPSDSTRCWIAVELLAHGDDAALLDRLRSISQRTGLPLVAAGDVHFHVRSRKGLHDTLTAIRLNTPVSQLGYALQPNAEQHLRSRLRLAQVYPPALLKETLRVAASCRFSLEELRYEYPREIVPEGHTPESWLRHLTFEGVALRYPDGLPAKVKDQIEHELALITELHYEPYFLTVADIVQFARARGILCQGRGSAANSAVCYCIGITEVDPARMSVLFERFISKERNEPPDIDVDFEHQRREEVIQYIYEKYGRHRAALTATVISYRPRSAVRDVGKALGIDAQQLDHLAKSHQWWDGRSMRAENVQSLGFDPAALVVQHWIEMTNTLMGFPRHLSQHTGGFVIARDSLTRLVPVENASMVDRSVIEWDKDDLDALGLLKVDVLALGMLSAIRRALDLISQRRGLPISSDPPAPARDTHALRPFRVQDIPAEDEATYEMMQRADTVGVFQIESRAQMSMLPRLKPAKFYDLVIEVAIVRPGPIQGGMVHPYLRRRQGLEPVEYPREEIKPALERTLGVPIFQEQVMQIAILAAGFTPGEADALRRAMAAWKRKGGLGPFHERLIQGMLARGYQPEFAERIFKQIQGFGEYGFPESHAASFALLVYISCWLKRHEPAAFLAAMLNSQPMGFYAPAQLVRDAREHGIEVRAADVLISAWDSTLEEVMDVAPAALVVRAAIDPRPQPAVRLGLNRIGGLTQAGAQRLIAARTARLRERLGLSPTDDLPALHTLHDVFAFDSTEDLVLATRLDHHDLQALARAGALQPLAGHRVQANWEVAGIKAMPALLQDASFDEEPVALAPPTEGEETVADYHSTGIVMGRHPLSLLRLHLQRFGVKPAEELRGFPNGRLARASGIVTHRQRPQTAKGVVFVTLEDETGAVNVIIWPDLVERYRKEVMAASLMTVYGVWQCDTPSDGGIKHLIARRVVDHTKLLGKLTTRSRDFR